MQSTTREQVVPNAAMAAAASARERLLLFVANDADYFVAHWIERACAARDAGYDVHVAVPPGPGVAALAQQGFRIHTYPLSRKSVDPFGELRSIVALIRLYRRLKPDLVHHLTIKPMVYGGIAARIAGVAAVVDAVTGLGYVFGSGGFYRSMLRSVVVRLYRLALKQRRLRVTFENSEDKELFERLRLVDRRDSVLIKGAGVDMARFAPSAEPDGVPVVILAARLIWDKGIREFVDSARLLRAQGIAARFALVGDTDPGNRAAVPREQLAAWNAEGTVEWWGRRNDMPAVYRACHVACLPTAYREGIPRALIEAAACARPVIATRTGGCREVVIDGENGLLVPVGDAPALAAALRRLIEDRALRMRMGVRGRALVERDFSTQAVVRHTLDVYQALLD